VDACLDEESASTGEAIMTARAKGHRVMLIIATFELETSRGI